MYVDVKVGKRGEIVIPAFLRKRLKIKPGEKIMLSESGNKLEFSSKKKDVASRFEEIARKARLKEKDLVYGDELYEEVFG